IPHNATDLWYSFILLDTIGNEIETPRAPVHVIDNDDPAMGPDLTPLEATTGDPLTFSLSAEDNIQIEGITLEYWYEGGTVESVASPLDEFEHVITVEDGLEPIHYRFVIEDTSQNIVEGEVRSVRVSDNDAPAIDDDRTPTGSTTGENVTFLVHMADNIELNGTWVEYWFGGGEHANSSMDPIGEWNWTLTVDVPWDSLSPLHYIFHAQDTSGNWNSTARSTVTIHDNDLPWFGDDMSPDMATTGDDHLFAVQLYDNIVVADVHVEYWYNSGTHKTMAMTSGDQDIWTATIVTSHTVELLHYIFHVEDSTSNMNASQVRDVEMRDNDEPIIMADSSPGSTTTGVAYEFTVTITDNMGVVGVDITYWFDGGEQTSVPLTGDALDGNGNGTYALIIQIPSDSTDPLLYQVEARDMVGNANLTAERTIPVLDVTLPVAEAGDELNVDQHRMVTFSSEGSGDNVGIFSYTWTIKRGDVIVTLSGPSPVHTFDNAGTYAVTLT
ncbi:MAG: PKD domain-containing protein, partial [Thermoplasmata archaeon]|nr:PKD domain-containing protein [Thermoplasmata archaeon]